jgi:predicted GIY-YIG superfamily endonuclease
MGAQIMRRKPFLGYIPSSRSRNLYIGLRSDLLVRVHEHKRKAPGGFTARYNRDR